jgi:L-lactate dehydrogenase complex protein LldE
LACMHIGVHRMKVSLFVPCLVDQFHPEVAFSTHRLLRDLGYRVDYPEDQTCCGQPAYNAGYWNEAVPLAEHFLRVFRHCEYVVAPSGSCVSMVRNSYPKLPLSDEAKAIHRELEGRIFELTEFIVKVHGETSVGAVFNHRVTYHDSCHLLRELGVKDGPRELLRRVEGLELVEMENSEDCCGFGGVFSAKYARLAGEIAASKIEKASRTGAEYVVACDTGCLNHLETVAREVGARIKPIHIASVLRPGDLP